MQRNWRLLAIAIGAVGALTTIIFGAATTGDARIIGVTVGLKVTAYLVLLMVYFGQKETSPNATPVAEATPAATPVAKPTEPVIDPVATVTPTPAVVTAATETYYDFKGDIHDVIDVEGIGPKYAERLTAIGVTTTAHLCYRDADELAAAIDAPAKTVRKWQAMAEHAKVNGIGKQYAEALVRAGIDGIDELKRRSPATIAEQVTEYLSSLDNSVLGQKVTSKRVEGWQNKARSMRRVRQAIPA